MPKIFFLLLVLTTLSCCRAADFQAKTADGQVVQGEYLGTENSVVRIKTPYGTVSIPSKDIVSLAAVESPKPGATPAAPVPSLTPLISSNTEESKNDGLVFKEPRGVNLMSLLASRMPQIPEAIKQNRLELVRLIRNFAESSDASRARIIRTLQNFGLMAYPFVEAAYTAPYELADKIELLQSVAQPHKPYSAGMLKSTHTDALADLSRTTSAPPPLPPELLTKEYRHSPTRAQVLRGSARNVRYIEGYAAVAGGPFNTLLLWGIYKERYGGESDPLLQDLLTDKQRLLMALGDFKSKTDAWHPDDRIMLIEQALPAYFKQNDDLHDLTQDFLKKLLPEKHPKWDAPQAEWVEWWMKAKEELKKK